MKVIFESFGAGLAFACGAFIGVAICVLINSGCRKKDREEMAQHLKTVENRLASQVSSLIKIAESAESISKK